MRKMIKNNWLKIHQDRFQFYVRLKDDQNTIRDLPAGLRSKAGTLFGVLHISDKGTLLAMNNDGELHSLFFSKVIVDQPDS